MASANAGSEGFAAAGTLALGGSAAGNYTLVGITSNGSAETVGQLAVVLSGAKTYDATTNAAASGLTISNDLSGANLTLSGTGTLASANAGSELFAAAGSLILGGSAAGNYTLANVTTNGSAETIGQLAVVLSGAKTYDATTNAAASTLTISNDLNGANLTISGTGTLASANAGSETFASAGSLALGGSAAGNYTLVGITSNGSAETVGQLAVVLTGAKTYDATTNAAAANLTISNDLSGANLTLSGTGTLTSANAGSEAFAAAGSLVLGGSAAGNYTLANVTTNGSAENVGQLAVVLTGAKTYDATTNAAASSLTISNNLNGGNLTLSGTGTLASANAGSEAFAAAGSLALGGSAAGNYTLANVTTNGSAESVGQLAVVLTGSKTYDATTNAAASGLTISNDLNGANLTLSGTGTLASANAGSEAFAAVGIAGPGRQRRRQLHARRHYQQRQRGDRRTARRGAVRIEDLRRHDERGGVGPHHLQRPQWRQPDDFGHRHLGERQRGLRRLSPRRDPWSWAAAPPATTRSPTSRRTAAPRTSGSSPWC